MRSVLGPRLMRLIPIIMIHNRGRSSGSLIFAKTKYLPHITKDGSVRVTDLSFRLCLCMHKVEVCRVDMNLCESYWGAGEGHERSDKKYGDNYLECMNTGQVYAEGNCIMGDSASGVSGDVYMSYRSYRSDVYNIPLTTSQGEATSRVAKTKGIWYETERLRR